MPKRGVIALSLTAIALVLLLNFQVPSGVATLRTGGGTIVGGGNGGATKGSGSTSGNAPTSTGQAGGGDGSASGGSTSTGAARIVDGPVVDTRFGPVQVEITLDGRTLADIQAIELPSGGRSGQISSYVEPVLRSQALQAQGGNIDGVSGATFTSVAYAQSLQAALDSAGS